MNFLDLGYAIAAVVTAPAWARKARGDWRARFGHTDTLPDAARPRVMLHAVSVGEVNALLELVPMLTGTVDVVVSTTTDTGIARARALYQELEHCTVVRYPLDATWSVRRFLDAVKPDVVGLVELELWPNFMRACEKRGIPVAVINGRLSERSFRGYHRLKNFVGPTFRRLSLAAVQDGAYADRFHAMGVPPELLRITGSMKWDTARVDAPAEGADELAKQMGIDRARPLIVAGSTGPIDGSGGVGGGGGFGAEEALLHEACPPGVQLLCAPRRPERFNDAREMLGGADRCAARSANTPAPAGTDRYLLDTIGELRAAYALADVVVVGRTFGTLHGSDPIEPVALAKPVVIGPDMKNFEHITRTLLDAGAIVRTDAADLARTLATLLADDAQRAELAERGCACVREHQGATARHAGLLLELAGGRARAPFSDPPDQDA